MPIRLAVFVFAAFALLRAPCASADDAVARVASPGGELQVELRLSPDGMARYRVQRGGKELQVSPIGLGCSGFWGHRRFAEGAAAAVVEHALAQGVNLLDEAGLRTLLDEGPPPAEAVEDGSEGKQEKG